MRMKKQDLTEILINKMFEFAEIDMTVDKLIDSGKTKTDMLWMDEYSMTQEQHDKFKRFATNLIRRRFKLSARKVDQEFAWFDLMYGLKVIRTDNSEDHSNLEFEDLA